MLSIIILTIALSLNGVDEPKEMSKAEAFLATGKATSTQSVNPHDYDMTTWINAEGESCFKCSFPGDTCSLYNTTCFEID